MALRLVALRAPRSGPCSTRPPRWVGDRERAPLPNKTPHSWLGVGRAERLRERLENSNYVLLKIPIEIHNLGHGQRLICMDSARLPEELGLTSQEIESLRQVGFVRPLPQKRLPKIRVDYEHSNRPTPDCSLKAPSQTRPNLPVT
jgi:hypothetical protein